jgi:hypothetical protein
MANSIFLIDPPIELAISETTISIMNDGLERDLSEEEVMQKKEDTVDASVK